MYKLLQWRAQITWLCGMEFFINRNDGAMETVEYMCHVGRYLVHARLDYVNPPRQKVLVCM